ncbi:MAG: type II toxin-antitoxin system HicA family toxin [Methanobacteriota archaeon]
MSKLKPVSTRKLIRILMKLGFVKIRQKGSHSFFQHPDGRSTVVPIHSGEKISIGLLHEILKEIEVDRNEYQKLL